MKFQGDLPAALFIAVPFAFFGMAVARWLVWAVALTALLLILQTLSRREKRLDEREKGGQDSDPQTGKEGGPEGYRFTRE